METIASSDSSCKVKGSKPASLRVRRGIGISGLRVLGLG